jgi:hypothetical protein
MLKRNVLLIFALFGYIVQNNAQNQLYQEFGNSTANVADAVLYTISGTSVGDNNYATSINMNTQAGTNRGRNQFQRGIFKFIDFQGGLPSNAIIDKAELEFYIAMPSSWHNNPNESYVRRVLSSWQETTVTWNNQPNAETADQKVTQSFPLGYQGWENVDVTDHVQYFIDNPSEYHGWKLELVNEQRYRLLIVRTSDYDNGSKAPRLKVWYHLPIQYHELSSSFDNGSYYNTNSNHLFFKHDFKYTGTPMADYKVLKLGTNENVTSLTSISTSTNDFGHCEVDLDLSLLPHGFYIFQVSDEKGENLKIRFHNKL